MIYYHPEERRVRWTYVFIAACVVGFLVQQITDAWVYFMFFPAFAWEAPWMFVTSIFLHGDVSHILFNMIALFFFGTYLERMIGGRAFAALFLISGVVGNVGYLLTASDPLVPALGASGAIYGVVGTLAVLSPFTLVFIYGMVPVPMIVAAAIWGLLDFAGLFEPSGIAHGSHLGGMFIGILYGVYLRINSRRVRFD
jgi:hypothetical protein